MSKSKSKWWISWYGCWETLGEFELYTPWWESGCTGEDPARQMFCAAVWADDEDEIKEIIYGCYDKRPDDIEFRFMEQRPDDWDPVENKSGRFEFAEWMKLYWQRGEYRQEA